MVDVFGGVGAIRGRNGPPGPRGLRGLPGSIRDLCIWLPGTVLANLQKYDERGSYFVQDPDKDLHHKAKPGQITKWCSRSSTGGGLDAERPCNSLVKLNGYYALEFKQNSYTASEGVLMQSEPGLGGFICITFRMAGEGEQVLVSDYDSSKDEYCEIRVTETEVILHLQSHDEMIQHSCRDWTTVFVEYNSDETTIYFRYNVNGTTGSFTRPSHKPIFWYSVFTMGSRSDQTHYLTGAIAALEIYQSKQPSEVPEELQEIVIKNQQDIYKSNCK